jgi:16S rRNA processing protein RimM
VTPDSKSPTEPGAEATIGRLGRPHGLKGDLLLDGCSLTADELMALGAVTWRSARGETRRLEIRAAKAFMAKLQIRFRGFGSRDEAAELTNGELWAPRGELPDAGPGQVYTFQLIGLRAETSAGRALGEIVDVIHSGAHPIYVIGGEKELMIPATEPFVRKVDLEAGLVVVDLPEGIEEL